jgi:hypothetical protein
MDVASGARPGTGPTPPSPVPAAVQQAGRARAPVPAGPPHPPATASPPAGAPDLDHINRVTPAHPAGRQPGPNPAHPHPNRKPPCQLHHRTPSPPPRRPGPRRRPSRPGRRAQRQPPALRRRPPPRSAPTPLRPRGRSQKQDANGAPPRERHADRHPDRRLRRCRAGGSSLRTADIPSHRGPLRCWPQPARLRGMAPGVLPGHHTRHRPARRGFHRARRDPDRRHRDHRVLRHPVPGHALPQPPARLPGTQPATPPAPQTEPTSGRHGQTPGKPATQRTPACRPTQPATGHVRRAGRRGYTYPPRPQ